MKIFLFTLAILSGLTGYCQMSDVPVLRNEKRVGTILSDGSGIYGTEYVFPEEIHGIFYDYWTGYITLKLRGSNNKNKLYNTGTIVQYDLGRQMALWSKPVSYIKDNIHFYNNAIIQNTGKKSFFLDVHTGQEKWELKNNIYYVEPIDNIGIGYDFYGSLVNSNDLQGINLKTGNVIWERYLLQEYGWNDMFYIDDSTLAVVAAGLNTVNIHTGKGWHIHMKTSENDYSGMIAANAIGIAAGLLTGTFFISTGHDVVTGLVSNVLVDDTYMYLATHESLIKVDKNTGAVSWNYLFANNLTSESSIFINGDILYMVNLGRAYAGMDQIFFGEPFFAAFNKQTGQQLFMSRIYTKKDPILDFEIRDGEIFFLFKNKIMKYKMDTGSAISEQFFPPRVGEFHYFIGDEVFVETEDEYFMPLRETDSRYLYISLKENTIAIDNHFNITLDIRNRYLNLNYLETDDFKFISKGNSSLIINAEGEAVAEVEASTNAFLIGQSLYDTEDNRLIAIDLSEIINTK